MRGSGGGRNSGGPVHSLSAADVALIDDHSSPGHCWYAISTTSGTIILWRPIFDCAMMSWKRYEPSLADLGGLSKKSSVRRSTVIWPLPHQGSRRASWMQWSV